MKRKKAREMETLGPYKGVIPFRERGLDNGEENSTPTDI